MPVKSKSWTRFNNYLYRYWKQQTIVILSALVTVPISLFVPYLSKMVIDRAFGQKDLKLFMVLFVIAGIIIIINGAISVISKHLSQKINLKVRFDMTNDTFRHLQSLPMRYIDNHSTGEFMYRIRSDVRSVSGFVCNTVPKIVNLIPRIILIIVVVFRLDRRMAFIALLIAPLSYIHPIIFGDLLKKLFRQQVKGQQKIFKTIHEIFTHIKISKSLGTERLEQKRFEKVVKDNLAVMLENRRLENMGAFLRLLITRGMNGFMALSGGYMVIKGTMTLGSLTAIMIYLNQLNGLLRSTSELYNSIKVNTVTLHRLDEIISIQSDSVDGPGSSEVEIEKAKIKFENVSFGYNKNMPVLQGVNFTVEPGAKVALVGSSGCGKTTIGSLVTRLYNIDKGTVSIDGCDTRLFTFDSLRSQIGVALQRPFLWNDSVKNNILYGSGRTSYEAAVSAAKVSCAHDFIKNLPNEYDSVIGEMASKLSHGQRQRIAIARAVARKPKILLLDEAMSAIDPLTEGKIMKNVACYLSDSTVILVSHRLSSVEKMDTVYYFESPARVVMGTHDEMIGSNEKYRKLFSASC